MYEKANDRKVEMNYGWCSCCRKYVGDEGKGKLPIILHKKQMLYVVMLEETMQVIPLFMVVRNLL